MLSQMMNATSSFSEFSGYISTKKRPNDNRSVTI
jgi:hypothetical protein